MEVREREAEQIEVAEEFEKVRLSWKERYGLSFPKEVIACIELQCWSSLILVFCSLNHIPRLRTPLGRSIRMSAVNEPIGRLHSTPPK